MTVVVATSPWFKVAADFQIFPAKPKSAEFRTGQTIVLHFIFQGTTVSSSRCTMSTDPPEIYIYFIITSK
jgi:hypothetical protein